MAKQPNQPAAKRFWRVPTPILRIYRNGTGGVMRQIARSREFDRRVRRAAKPPRRIYRAAKPPRRIYRAAKPPRRIYRAAKPSDPAQAGTGSAVVAIWRAKTS